MKRLNLTFYLSGLFIVSAFITAFAAFYNVDHIIIVHFDAIKGIDFLGTKYDILGVWLIGFSIAVINGLLSRMLFSRDQFLAWGLALVNVVLAFLMLVAIVVIILNN